MSNDDVDEIEDARKLLVAAEVVYGKDEDCPNGDQVLNMNDTWAWATAWGETIPDEELPRVASLVRQYGYCGALYWVSERHKGMRSEFEDINRFVEFVRMEEAIRVEVPHSSKRAYTKKVYSLGMTHAPGEGG